MPPQIVDTYANDWRLDATGVVGVRPAGGTIWQQVPVEPAAGWQFLLADSVGFVWIGGPAGLRRLDPHRSEVGWQQPEAIDLPSSAVTALTRSAEGLALVGFATGEIVEIDIDAAGQTIARVLPPAPAAIRDLACDEEGGLLVTTEDGQDRRQPGADAWQHSWRDLARLPGGNHDLYAIAFAGRMWLAGGLSSGHGYPPQTHVFDELFAYDPAANMWAVVSRMPLPRCYSGIAGLAGRIWIVGGAANLTAPDDPDGARVPLADVRIFDPESGAWHEGPPLSHRRLEPVVVETGGRIWVIGGTDGASLTHVESIGAGETNWRVEAPLPWPQNQADGCVVGGVIYCMSRAGFLCFDPTSGEWETGLPQLAESPQAPQMALFRDRIWVMGGSRRRDTNVYDPTTRTWARGPDLPTDNSWGAALDLHGTLIIAGGAHWSECHQRYFFDDRVLALK